MHNYSRKQRENKRNFGGKNIIISIKKWDRIKTAQVDINEKYSEIACSVNLLRYTMEEKNIRNMEED